ncbi:excinuclease ABC subunit UvrA [Verrucomicrobia bacterium LW23]|nr:excinuclease ABC subunit UvrA [Verrucomicrobia bacterium LW23]
MKTAPTKGKTASTQAKPGKARASSPATKLPATPEAPAAQRITARSSIAIQGARVHNLKNVSLEIPRDKLVVVTGLSGSGKSSLAFDTIYAEGQRRYMESLSTFAKRFIAQVAKPDVDFMFGLSPVISIEQKTVANNPRSTVGTMTDVASYLNLLFSTVGEAHCPRTGEAVPVRSSSQILEAVLALPKGTQIELRAPVFPVYGEDLEFLFTEVRKKGCRHVLVDGKPLDLSETVEVEEDGAGAGGAASSMDVGGKEPEIDVIVDRLIVSRDMEKQLKAGILNTLLIGDQLLKIHLPPGTPDDVAKRFYATFGSKTQHMVYGDISPDFFMFNKPESACRTCGGLGTDKKVHPDLIIPDPRRSIRDGCFAREAFKYNPDTWDGRIMHSLALHAKFDLDTPWMKLPKAKQDIILFGIETKFPLRQPPDAKGKLGRDEGREMGFGGIARRIERQYRRYRQKGEAQSMMEEWLNKVTVEHTCPDCQGARLRRTRLLFKVGGAGARAKSVHQLGDMNFDELRPFLETLELNGRGAEAGRQVLGEIKGRVDLLLGIGLDYLSFNRRSGTLSGGEAQRIRLSTQIGSGLMGMLYILDEPSIGLHSKDNVKMIETLRNLRDLGNTVIVVEHDEDTIRAADHVVEMGPGPGVHGGQVVVQGTLDDILACEGSPTGQYLSGRKCIRVPQKRRAMTGARLVVRGAKENNLKDIDVEIPLGQFVAVTGASGSGKSTLVNDILYKRLWKELIDTRTLAGEHDDIEGISHISRVVNIDQAPIGRNSRSNPATYIGFYDNIRNLFAAAPLSVERGYTPGRFSFNVKGGRCEDCQGEGTISTQLFFMPDVEVLCTACKGARYNSETLEVAVKGKTIADVLDMSIEEALVYFEDQPRIRKMIEVLHELGLDYLTIGQSATTLSGGEAQRIKLASELSRLQRGKPVLYILDEPTTGLHLADIQRLLDSLHRLVHAGHTVLVIEHHLDVIKTADHIIDLGPEGGRGGGRVVVAGRPEAVAACGESHTGRFLKPYLEKGA